MSDYMCIIKEGTVQIILCQFLLVVFVVIIAQENLIYYQTLSTSGRSEIQSNIFLSQIVHPMIHHENLCQTQRQITYPQINLSNESKIIEAQLPTYKNKVYKCPKRR